MLLSIKKTGNGVNKDLLPSELLPGQWSDCLNMRFRNEFAEKFKGIQAAYSVPTITPYWLETYISTAARFVVLAGTAKAFCDDGMVASEITPFGEGLPVGSLTASGTTATLLTIGAHGRTTGDTVTVYLAAPDAYNGSFTITVLPALATPVNGTMTAGFSGGTLAAGTHWYRVTAFTWAGETLASTETSCATTGTTGTVTVAWGAVTGAVGYKIYGRTSGAQQLLATVGAVTSWVDTGALTPAGALPVANTSSPGFTYTMARAPGMNAFALGAYSTATAAPFTGTRDDRITGGVLGGVLLLNSPKDGLYYWAGSASARLRKVPGCGFISDVARPFKNFVVFLGATVANIKRPHNVRWSKSAEPGAIPIEFVATTANDAGDVDLAETPGWLVDCLPMGDVNIVYKQDARYSMQYIGGNDVFRFQRLPGNDGLLARGCVVNTPKGHVFLSNGDVKIHNGGEAVSIADGRVRKWIFDTMDSSRAQRSFLCLNPQKTEVWVVFPSLGKSDCDTIAAWNWDADAWGLRSAPGLTCAANGLIAASLTNGAYTNQTQSYDNSIQTYSENEYSPNESRLIVGAALPRIGLAETGTSDFNTPLPWRLERRGLALDDPDSVKTFSASRPQVRALAGTVLQVYHGSGQTADSLPDYAAPVDFTVGTSNWANAFASGGRYLSYKLAGVSPQPVALRSFDIDFTKMGRF